MQIRIGAALALAVTAWLAAPLAPAAADPEKASPDCTIVGTPGPDVLRGTKRDDVICGLGGDDKIQGRGGDDLLKGGAGDDTIKGGPGDDELGGGRGDDTLNGHDAVKYSDELRCGRGKDEAIADGPDKVRNSCEQNTQQPPTDLALSPSTIAENRPVGAMVGTLSATDPDAGDTHAFTLVAGTGSADNGSFSVSGTELRTAANLDFETHANLSIRVRATDAAGLTFEKPLTVTVTDADDPPTAVDDTTTVLEDAPSTAIDVLANDTDTDGGPKNVASVTQPAHGSVVITGGGSGLTYQPNANYCNDPGAAPTDDFTYTLNGGDVGAVQVTVTCVDDTPVANDDSATVAEDSGATAINVLANDNDPEADPFTIGSVTQPTNGTVVVTGGGTGLTYAPNADYCNDPGAAPVDTFTYTLTPGGDVATVSVTVTCANDGPVAVNDTRSTTEDTDLVVTGANLTANDTDADGDTLIVTAVSSPTGGTVNLAAGTVTFTATANLCGAGAGAFDYTVSDGTDTDTGQVTVDITCVNDPPDAVNDNATVAEDSGATTINVLTNDTDVENDPITVTGVTQPTNGAATFTAADVSYQPGPNFCGSDSFTYTINGGDTATVSVTVTCVNDAPELDLDSGAAGTSSASTFAETNPHSGTGVLIAPNATVTDIDDANLESLTVVLPNRPDGDAFESLSATLSAGITGSYNPVTGTLALTGSASKAAYAAVIASIRYDNTKNPPNPANRTITVVVNDGDVDSAAATATVQVVPLNVPPVNTVPGPQTTNEDTPLTFGAGAAISVTDADSASLTVQVQVTNGTFTLSTTAGLTVTGNSTADVTFSGTLAALNTALNGATYTPALNYNGPAQLTITSTDSLSASDTDTVAITVTAVNDAPTATNLSAAETYTEDVPLNLVNIVVSDVDSTTVTATLTLSSPSAGSLNTGTSGTVTSTYNAGTGVWSASGAIADVNTLLAGVNFTPAPNFNANFTIATSVTDGIAAPVTGSKPVTGQAVNDAPTSTAPGAQTTDEDVSKAITGMAVADVDNPTLAVTLSVTNGTMTLGATTGLTFTTGDGTADATMTFSGSIANLNAAISSVTYAPTANYNGPSTLTFTVSDAIAAPVVKTVNITVTPVNDAPVADDETFNGANSAIGNTTLVVDDPTDGAPSATGPRKTITGDVLAGDTDVDGDTLSVVPGTITTGGGTVVIEADGDFTLLPPAGCAASYSFDYTVTDGGSPVLTDTGTVTVAVTECVWYVDSAAGAGGSGRSTSPFQTLAPVNGAGGAGDLDDDSDYLFVQAGTYNTGLVLESNQRLFGQPHGLTVAGTALVVSGGGSNPTISNGGGNGLTLSNGNNVQGINLGSTPAANSALAGSAVGSATMNTVTSGSINNTTGGAVDITNGTLAMAFTSVSSNNASGDGIRLDNTAGTFTGSGGSLQNAGGQDVDLSGNNATDDIAFTYDGTITDDQGQLVNVANQNGGTKDFNGAITDGNDGDGNGISLTSNTGATVRFDGGVTLSTGANLAFTATGGGTVAVTDPNAVGTAPDNTLTTTTGTALNVANTTIGSDDLTFRSVSSNGAANGIVLTSTGAPGNLVVTGTGTTAGSGGTITNTTSDGVAISSSAAPSFSNLTVSNTGRHGMSITSTSSPTFTGVQLSNTGNADNEYGLNLINTSGTLTINSSSFNTAGEKLVYVENTNQNLTVNVASNSSFAMPATGVNPVWNQAIELAPNGSSAFTATVQSSSFTNINASAILLGAATAGSNGTSSLTVSGNTMTGKHNPEGRATGIAVSGQEGTTTNLSISNNTFTNAGGNGVISIDVNDSSLVTGTVSSNTITNPPGIGLFTAVDEAATARLTITGNQISSAGGDGIQLVNFGGVGASTLRAEVTNNTVNGHSEDTAVSFVGGISVTSFEETTNLALRGNTVTGTPPSPTQCGGAPCVDYYIEEVGGTMVAEEIPNTADTTLNAAYVNSTNDAGLVTIFGIIDLSNGADIAP